MRDLKRILIPTDFSDNATVVYDYARKLAASKNAVVDMIHIVPQRTYLDISQEIMGNALEMQGKFREYMVNLRTRLQKELDDNFERPHNGKVFVKEGLRIAQEISDHAQAEGYELILIGSRGKGNSLFGRGSVTERLIRTTHIPVFSFHKPFHKRMKTIMLPTDGSALSLQILPLALDMAFAYKATIHLYNVIEIDFNQIGFAGGSSTNFEFVRKNRKNELIDYLKDHFDGSEAYAYKGGAGKNVVVIENKEKQNVKLKMVIEDRLSAHRAIVDYANENAQLVMMTTHGRSGLSRILIGSVAEKVARHLDVPACTLKPQKPES